MDLDELLAKDWRTTAEIPLEPDMGLKIKEGVPVELVHDEDEGQVRVCETKTGFGFGASISEEDLLDRYEDFLVEA